ncbi:helix-turn-helix domain-containing protein [Kitasatospora sp. NPDC018058]|uniref:helix-turn-helix domain-containing protein n=1 Tax=Kitasatospora sp. NPDC018058 TaxID=3364025 RepID=UPI0037BE855D
MVRGVADLALAGGVVRKFEERPGFVVQAYRFALDPNAEQDGRLRSHCGAARAAHNWAASWVKASWCQRRAEESYGIPEAELTAWRPWSSPALRKVFNEAKKTDPRFADWWEENSKEAYSTGLANAATAFDDYAKSKRGRRKGRLVGMPRQPAHRRPAQAHPPASRASTAPSSSKTSTWPGCSATADWPGRSRMPGSARSADRSPTRPTGPVAA